MAHLPNLGSEISKTYFFNCNVLISFEAVVKGMSNIFLHNFSVFRHERVIKRNYSTHSVSTIIKNILIFVASNTRKLLFMSTKLNLNWNRIDKDYHTYN